MQTHQTDFSKGNVYRNIMEVAVPMIIAQILNLLYNIVDRIYIGRIPEIGATALTGVGLCFPIITLITAFTYLFGNGGSPLCSMERGRGNEKEAEMLMGNTFVMLIGTGMVLTVIGLVFYRPILYAFGASDVTFPYAASYIKIYLLGTLFVMITLGMNPFINSQGFGNTGMFTILIGVVLNIVLDLWMKCFPSGKVLWDLKWIPMIWRKKSFSFLCLPRITARRESMFWNPTFAIPEGSGS